MQHQEIFYDVADHIATVTLNRPAKLNAWTAVMEQEVRSAMEAADADNRFGSSFLQERPGVFARERTCRC